MLPCRKRPSAHQSTCKAQDRRRRREGGREGKYEGWGRRWEGERLRQKEGKREKVAKKVPGGTRKEKLKEEKRCESEGKKASKGQKK